MTSIKQNIAARIAAKLDASDKLGKNRIDKDTWAAFVTNEDGTQFGKKIHRYITLDKAIKSIGVYLSRQSGGSESKMRDLEQQWLNKIDKMSNAKPERKNPPKTHCNILGLNSVIKNKREIAMQSRPKTDYNIYGVDTTYSRLYQSEAEAKAKKDSRLEYLDKGYGWSVDESHFYTDIRYARKNTGKILSYIAKKLGIEFIVTSALGTKGSSLEPTPHIINEHYCTHHNANNNKLDIMLKDTLQQTRRNTEKLANRLFATGLFTRAKAENVHVDMQIKPEVYLALERGESLDNICRNIRT